MATPALAAGRSLNIACDTCGFCPAPFGICILFYIIALLAILLVVIIVFMGKKKKCPVCKEKTDKSTPTCQNCGYDFESGLQSTLTANKQAQEKLSSVRKEDKGSINSSTEKLEIYCPRCGNEHDPKAFFCGKCGMRLR